MTRKRRGSEDDQADLRPESAADQGGTDGTGPADGTVSTSPGADALARWRKENRGKPRHVVRASYFLFGVRPDGTQQFLRVESNPTRMTKYLMMVDEILRSNYVGVTVIKGKDVTGRFRSSVEGQ